MEKFEIKRNPKPLTDEQINRHKNFDKLIGEHTKLLNYREATKPLYKSKKLLGLIIVISVVVLVIVLDETEQKKQVDTNVDTLKTEQVDSLNLKINKD